MHNDASHTGIRKWCCPSLVSVVAGLIVIATGGIKLMGGEPRWEMVGNMALGGLHIDPTGLTTLAVGLGLIAGIIEVVGGVLFGLGCRRTAKWAAVFLSIVMAVAILFKLANLKPLEGNWFEMFAGFMGQLQVDLLLFAVFFSKALKFAHCWYYGADCCTGACAVPIRK